MMAKLSEYMNKFNKRAAISLTVILGLTIVGIALRARSEKKNGKGGHRPTALSTDTKEKVIKTQEQTGKFEESKVISEWQAFSVYHPNSGLSEDSLFKNFRKVSMFSHDDNNKDSTAADTTAQVLGARSLIPILRETFGDQARGNAEVESDPWFLSHPTALFNPRQMKALCDRENDSEMEDDADFCWKPVLTDEYLATLADFAGDACPQLVLRESRQSDRLSNKLLRSNDFKEQNVKYFAVRSLRLPAEIATDEWILKIIEESKRALALTENPEDGENQAELNDDELYALSCQALILSHQFYSR